MICSKTRFAIAALITGVLTFGLMARDLRGDISTGIYPRIVINNTVGASGSQSYATPFSSVVAIGDGGGPYCTGVLIAPNVVLTARHCGVIAGDQIRFGPNANSPLANIFVSSVFTPNTSGGLLSGNDLQIVTLASSVSSAIATPMRLTDATTALLGTVGVMIGYGAQGLGSTGHSNSSNGFRWGGENIIDRYGVPASQTGANIFSTDFDNGTGAANTISGSSLTPLFFEATTAPGDSGGPLLINFNNEWLVAGVLSGGTTANSVYGDISWWTGVAPFRTQIQSFGGAFVAVPEPASGMAVVVVFLFGIRLRQARIA